MLTATGGCSSRFDSFIDWSTRPFRFTVASMAGRTFRWHRGSDQATINSLSKIRRVFYLTLTLFPPYFFVASLLITFQSLTKNKKIVKKAMQTASAAEVAKVEKVVKVVKTTKTPAETPKCSKTFNPFSVDTETIPDLPLKWPNDADLLEFYGLSVDQKNAIQTYLKSYYAIPSEDTELNKRETGLPVTIRLNSRGEIFFITNKRNFTPKKELKKGGNKTPLPCYELTKGIHCLKSRLSPFSYANLEKIKTCEKVIPILCGVKKIGKNGKIKASIIMPKALDDLNGLIRLKDRISFDTRMQIIRDIVEAVKDIHRQGMIHGDIKSGNFVFIMSETEKLKVMAIDFDFLRVVQEQLTLIPPTKGYRHPSSALLKRDWCVLNETPYMPKGYQGGFSVDSFGGFVQLGKEVDFWATGILILEILTLQFYKNSSLLPSLKSKFEKSIKEMDALIQARCKEDSGVLKEEWKTIFPKTKKYLSDYLVSTLTQKEVDHDLEQLSKRIEAGGSAIKKEDAEIALKVIEFASILLRVDKSEYDDPLNRFHQFVSTPNCLIKPSKSSKL